MRSLLRFVRPYRKLVAVSLITLVGMVVIDLSIPRLIERIIDEGVKQRDLEVVLRTSAVMLGLSLLSATVAVLNSLFSIRVGENVARDLREAIFVKIQSFSFGNMDKYSTGALMVRLTSDASAVQRLTQVSLRIGTRAPLLMIGSVILMFVTSPTLAATMVPLLFLTALAIVFFSRRMEPLFRTVQQKLDRLNTVLQENVAGARLVKSFVRGDYEESRFEEANGELTDGTVKVMRFMSSMTPVLSFCVYVGMVLVVWLGGLQAIHGGLSLGRLVAFTNYLLTTMNPLILMTQLSNTWANGLASAARINEVLETEPEVREGPAALPLPENDPFPVSFDAVEFHYNANADLAVLEDVCLTAEPGTTLAILGATGSGKTSLVNLIPRFYDVARGEVALCGIDVRNLRGDSLAATVGIVPQETILFSGTVRDNIRYARPEATAGEVEEAAKVAAAHEFIMKLPKAYDTRVEERGCNLSGGQKQRIAIARAIVARPRVLVLDDSTSSVDVETEAEIEKALKESMAGCTIVMVAQRISTVLNADKIIVLDGGRIVAEGRHAELLARSPIYREIYDSQLGGGIEEVGHAV